MSSTKIRETDLYLPIKAFLEAQGYEVKAEVGPADVVAMRGDELPVVVELKTQFSLALFHQAIDRLALTDTVYVAVPRKSGRPFQKGLAANLKLARRLGLGLLTVRLRDGFVEIHVDPGPYAPRQSNLKRTQLLREFARRQGDPNMGGTRGGIVTAYRQDMERIAAHLGEHGASRGNDVKVATGIEHATRMMRDDHYAWFEKVEKGVYRLTKKGAAAVSVKATSRTDAQLPDS
jgi:hypothetical protein